MRLSCEVRKEIQKNHTAIPGKQYHYCFCVFCYDFATVPIFIVVSCSFHYVELVLTVRVVMMSEIFYLKFALNGVTSSDKLYSAKCYPCDILFSTTFLENLILVLTFRCVRVRLYMRINTWLNFKTFLAINDICEFF